MRNLKHFITKSNTKVLDICSLIIAALIMLPIINFLREGFAIILNGNFSIGLTGREEIIGTIKILILISLIGGGLGIINAWLLSNCNFKFRKILRIIQLIPLASPAILLQEHCKI